MKRRHCPLYRQRPMFIHSPCLRPRTQARQRQRLVVRHRPRRQKQGLDRVHACLVYKLLFWFAVFSFSSEKNARLYAGTESAHSLFISSTATEAMAAARARAARRKQLLAGQRKRQVSAMQRKAAATKRKSPGGSASSSKGSRALESSSKTVLSAAAKSALVERAERVSCRRFFRFVGWYVSCRNHGSHFCDVCLSHWTKTRSTQLRKSWIS